MFFSKSSLLPCLGLLLLSACDQQNPNAIDTKDETAALVEKEVIVSGFPSQEEQRAIFDTFRSKSVLQHSNLPGCSKTFHEGVSKAGLKYEGRSFIMCLGQESSIHHYNITLIGEKPDGTEPGLIVYLMPKPEQRFSNNPADWVRYYVHSQKAFLKLAGAVDSEIEAARRAIGQSMYKYSLGIEGFTQDFEKIYTLQNGLEMEISSHEQPGWIVTRIIDHQK